MILDSLGMFDAAAAFPELMGIAAHTTRSVLADAVLPHHDEVANVVLIGIGTAGDAGALVLEATGPTLPIPIVVHREYGVPNFVDGSSLVIALSFDGDTAETVEAVQNALADGAHVVCVSGGGELERLAESEGLIHLPVVAGAPVARAAIGVMSVPVLVLFDRLGLYPGADAWIAAAIEQTTRRRDALIAEDNLSRRLAHKLGRMFPIIYGGNGPGGMAASFWKTQFNENAKVAAFANQAPELTHTEIVGWGQDGDVTRQIFQVFMLRHDFEHPLVSARLDVVDEILDEVVGGVHRVDAEGDGLLAQLFDLVLIGQFASLHAAVEQGVDPGPVPIVDTIASRVGEL